MAADNTPVTDRPTPPYAATVSAEWTASAAHPVAGRAGEHLVATARVEDWRETPGWTWRWCRDSQGREGWAPEALLMVAGDGSDESDESDESKTATLREDYDARELTVAVGARLTVERELAGWAFCRAEDGADGARGWVPLACLRHV